MEYKLRVCLLVLVLSGCATTTYAPPSPITSDSLASAASRTSAVFVRERAEPTAWNVAVIIDDKRMASIANRSFSSFEVQPGKHSIKIGWPLLAGQLDLKGDVEFTPNETSYFLITAKYHFTGFSAGAIAYNTTVALIPLTRTEAVEIIGKLDAK